MAIEKLRVSLTKHGAYKVAILLTHYPIEDVIEHCRDRELRIDIDQAQARRNLSIDSDGTAPDYWRRIQAEKDDILINACVFISIVLSHHKLIETMIQSTIRNCTGRVRRGQVLDGKEYTNFANIVEELGFSDTERHIPEYMDFNFSSILASHKFARYIRDIIEQKLREAGLAEEDELTATCIAHQINHVFGLSASEFAIWLASGVHRQLDDTMSLPEEIESARRKEAMRHTGRFSFRSGHEEKREESMQVKGSGKTQKLTFLHNRIENSLYKALISTHGEKNVGSELLAGFGNKIDVVVREHGTYVFYEIKTHQSPSKCLREAIAQLIEYSYFPDEKRANKLVIVSQHEPTEQIITYIKHLRASLDLPLFYRHYDQASNRLGPRLPKSL